MVFRSERAPIDELSNVAERVASALIAPSFAAVDKALAQVRAPLLWARAPCSV